MIRLYMCRSTISYPSNRLQSSSILSLTSISSRISDPEDLNLGNICGCFSVKDQLGYLFEASDEELGIPSSRTSVEFDKLIDFNLEDDSCLNVESDFQEFVKMDSSFNLDESADSEFCEVATALLNDGNRKGLHLEILIPLDA